jgi:hypothetical protein
MPAVLSHKSIFKKRDLVQHNTARKRKIYQTSADVETIIVSSQRYLQFSYNVGLKKLTMNILMLQ